MSYSYEQERAKVLAPERQDQFIHGRDRLLKAIEPTGAILWMKAMQFFNTGSSWTDMACVDRMVELGDLRRVHQNGRVSGQYEVFVVPPEY